MPRKPMLYTSQLPYHVTARSNNREWFYVPIQDAWDIFVNEINKLTISFDVRVHAFVLMNNHYHLLLTMSEEIDLGKYMQLLQRSVSRRINAQTNRINHVFGGPYKGCLIGAPNYYAHVLKYVYRNPVKANISNSVEEYYYSTLRSDQTRLVLTIPPSSGIDCFVPDAANFLYWLNEPSTSDQNRILKKVLKKPNFTLAKREVTRFN